MSNDENKAMGATQDEKANKNNMMHAAIHVGDVGALKAALESGANPNAENLRGTGWSALGRAAFEGDVEILRALLKAGANVNARDVNGNSALHWAMQSQWHNDSTDDAAIGVVESLLDAGADVNAVNTSKQTPLHVAGQFNAMAMARVLLARGARTDLKDYAGQSPEENARAQGGCHTLAEQIRTGSAQAERADPQRREVQESDAGGGQTVWTGPDFGRGR